LERRRTPKTQALGSWRCRRADLQHRASPAFTLRRRHRAWLVPGCGGLTCGQPGRRQDIVTRRTGRTCTLQQDEHRELAVGTGRRVGCNFGVVTSFEFRLHARRGSGPDGFPPLRPVSGFLPGRAREQGASRLSGTRGPRTRPNELTRRFVNLTKRALGPGRSCPRKVHGKPDDPWGEFVARRWSGPMPGGRRPERRRPRPSGSWRRVVGPTVFGPDCLGRYTAIAEPRSEPAYPRGMLELTFRSAFSFRISDDGGGRAGSSTGAYGGCKRRLRAQIHHLGGGGRAGFRPTREPRRQTGPGTSLLGNRGGSGRREPRRLRAAVRVVVGARPPTGGWGRDAGRVT